MPKNCYKKNHLQSKEVYAMEEFNEQIVADILNKEDVSVEDKIKSILSGHEANVRGLIQKRDELLGNEKKLKEKINAYETEKNGFTDKITGLEEELKKNSPEEHKKYYDAQLLSRQKEFDTKLAEVVKERDFFKTSHLKRLQDDAVAEGIKDIQFIDGLKNGFIASVLMLNHFEAKDIDGKTVFLNENNKTIQEVMHDYALTTEGKAYIKNPSSGGNAHSTSTVNSSGGKQISREELAKMKDDERREFFRKGGTIV